MHASTSCAPTRPSAKGPNSTETNSIYHSSRRSDNHQRAPLSSPKQPQPERLKDWYPYYAGFSYDFARDVIQAYFPNAQSIIDPWNGSGTTTAAAASIGLTSVGIDINPALSIIARARLMPRPFADDLLLLAAEIIRTSKRLVPVQRRRDPLLKWLNPSSALVIRKLQTAIHSVTTTDGSTSIEDLSNAVTNAPSGLPIVTTFLYSALFAATRDILRPFRGSNPTWLATPKTPRHRIAPNADSIRRSFLIRAEYLTSRLRIHEFTLSEGSTILTGAARDVLAKLPHFDACLTSPPYATRIDYIKGSIPELSVLGVSDETIQALRRKSTGTPVVKGVASFDATLPSLFTKLLDRVSSHPSHGSANYYAPWLRNYLREIHSNIEFLASTINGRIAFVVQDSHYKSIHVDLQELVTNSFNTFGRNLLARTDFNVPHSMANVNTRARSHRNKRPPHESLLVFK